ncbi:hypothetical protein GFD17_06110 [Bifidobacterium sp. SMB2]|uniref:Uncharacterized protein n=1 Tax=Bifidobacterium saimiriisciurei TaxID=2661627 RepID=A0ABX0C7B6_9BIFI|nr:MULTISPECIES: hypothetical protein [Bifidobacterium]NEG96330.1 hypothetical protein [Bifidobacterium sp. SMB2]NEH11038.1 hypothetical protein [Bifidobacterium saimiriisciurei]
MTSVAASRITPTPMMENLDDSTLYDVFFESGTMLGGYLQSLMDSAEASNDDDAYRRWFAESLELNRHRMNTKHSDREEQIRLKREWDDRRRYLKTLL